MVAAATSKSLSTCGFACLAISDPVCASNGVTFRNACEFDQTKCTSKDETLGIVSQGACNTEVGSKDNINDLEALCMQEFACLDVYAPVCGSDEQTYSNECALMVAQCLNPLLTLVSTEECSSRIDSSFNATEDSNAMQVANSTSMSDTCVVRVCTKDYHPLCGSDGVMYDNDCLFENAQCINSSLSLAFETKCMTALGSLASILEPEVTLESPTKVESTPSETDGTNTSRKSCVLLLIVILMLELLY